MGAEQPGGGLAHGWDSTIRSSFHHLVTPTGWRGQVGGLLWSPASPGFRVPRLTVCRSYHVPKGK